MTSASSALDVWSAEGLPPTTRCAWCGKDFDSTDEVLSGRIRCARCGVATTSPWPTDEQLDHAYGSWYRPTARFGDVGDALLRMTRGTLARRIDAVAPAGRVLDVGAGDGTLVRALRARRRDAIGLERHSSDDLLLDAELSDIDGTWAAVVFWHSLEHLRAPVDALTQAARLLAPGGLLIVALPDSGSRQARIFGDHWLALDLPRHLVHVPAAALVEELSRQGLQITRRSAVRGGQSAFGWLHGLVGGLPGKPDLYNALRSPRAREVPVTPWRRAAILGAGCAIAPVAAIAAGSEWVRSSGGSVYVEARA